MLAVIALLMTPLASADWRDTNVGDWGASDWREAGAEWPQEVDASWEALQVLAERLEGLKEDTGAPGWAEQAQALRADLEAHAQARFHWGYNTQVIGEDRGAEHLDAETHARVQQAQARQAELEALFYTLDTTLHALWLQHLVDSEASDRSERVMAAGDLLGAIGSFDRQPGYPFDEQAVLLGLQHNEGNAAYAATAELCLELCTDPQALELSQQLLEIAADPLQNGGMVVYTGDEAHEMQGINDDPERGPLVRYSGDISLRRLPSAPANQLQTRVDLRLGRKRVGVFVGGRYQKGLQEASSGFAAQGGLSLDVVAHQRLQLWANVGLSYDGFGATDAPEYHQVRDLGLVAPVTLALPLGDKLTLSWSAEPRWTRSPDRVNDQLSGLDELRTGPRLQLDAFGDLGLVIAGERMWVPTGTVNAVSVGLCSVSR
ncbi:MAG: hypothetical protein VX899_03830 [Myxococcota bacterium]|nr:hypothetical protein [Myxococcota bacterium]